MLWNVANLSISTVQVPFSASGLSSNPALFATEMKEATATLSPAADEETWAVLRVAKYGVEKEYEIQAIATGARSIAAAAAAAISRRRITSPSQPV